ncbi:hypothetical protein GLOIN_2v1767482 [Rhizophagus irregularis DAOM 181602=DAOM 197198]|uniref:Uncharacterized protein n=1 Tax=Rhizophagus irregularis (strain DAOM 181602 / DAOM 197198 / MUCL 43194) TaxID=747089 RepID=U9UJU8_RHIID|nr:hypothetical protein GLOIN_2v1767482 [Rhizophagus irregularis DAOM 181602=DAOM 197198]POG77653.1 hypothetical protein GLOIN_2v1767482 [Rhizophagus irregularis DAOM 181602=DAOM 197198]|eukprot:XP_025184519.1 hypothetical protein GLOIN_2v1767482 [Rhizophagus irregularis DAOM 181602=DAOM 197198]
MLITTNKALAFYTETSNYGNNPPRYNLSPSSSNLEVSCKLVIYEIVMMEAGKLVIVN